MKEAPNKGSPHSLEPSHKAPNRFPTRPTTHKCPPSTNPAHLPLPRPNNKYLTESTTASPSLHPLRHQRTQTTAPSVVVVVRRLICWNSESPNLKKEPLPNTKQQHHHNTQQRTDEEGTQIREPPDS